jgi:hypothetical protein
MSPIKSQIGSSNFVPNPVKKYTVPEETVPQQIPQYVDYNEVQQMRRQAQVQSEQQERNSMIDAKNRVEYITEIGREYKHVSPKHENQNVTFTLRTLKKFEKRTIAALYERELQLTNGKATFKSTSSDDIKVETLSHALFSIDGQPLDIILGVYNLPYEKQKEAKEELIFNMDDALIDYLYSKYEELAKETSEKYEPKTEEDLKVAAEAISKSG